MTHFAQSGLGKRFWLFSFSYTVYWRNRAGLPSPFEDLFHFPPVCPQRLPFGCLVMCLRYGTDKRKLDSRALETVNLGPVSAGRKSRYLFSIATSRLISRSDNDCQFFPMTFPFASTPAHSPPDSHADDSIIEFVDASDDAVGVNEGVRVPDHVPAQAEKADVDVPQPEVQQAPSDQVPDDGNPSVLRRSTRIRSPPANDYSVHLPARRIAKPARPHHEQIMSCKEIIDLAEALFDGDSPTHREAMASPNAVQWLGACDEEVSSLYKKEAFRVVKTPYGVLLINAVWVLKRKRGRDGLITRYKARMCAATSMQVKGDTYDLTFSPTPTSTSLRTLLAFAVSRSWTLTQSDMVTAFLVPELPAGTKIYMRAPAGMDLPADHSLLLQRSLYGLHQSARP